MTSTGSESWRGREADSTVYSVARQRVSEMDKFDVKIGQTLHRFFKRNSGCTYCRRAKFEVF